MTRYFVMKPLDEDHYGTDYIYLDEAAIPEQLKRACRRGEFQYVDRDLSELSLAADCGDVCPDLLYDALHEIPLISDRLKDVFDWLDVRNLYYQRVRLTRKTPPFLARYWLAIPPRIDCLNRKASQILEDPECPDAGEATRIVVNEAKTGNYDIFKLSGVVNEEIIVSNRLREAVELIKPEGIFFLPVEVSVK